MSVKCEANVLICKKVIKLRGPECGFDPVRLNKYLSNIKHLNIKFAC